MNILRKLSVRPMINTDNLRSNVVYLVLAMDVYQDQIYYNVKGDNGVMAYILASTATIEDIEL